MQQAKKLEISFRINFHYQEYWIIITQLTDGKIILCNWDNIIKLKYESDYNFE